MEDNIKYKDILDISGEQNVININVSPEIAHNATQGVLNHLKEIGERLELAKKLQSLGNTGLDKRIYSKKK